MSERKSINRYIPPTFDPNALQERPPPVKIAPRTGVTGLVGSRKPQRTVRLMLPFTLRCSSCGEYIHKGRKFNARKETCWGETYLGVQIFRFYIRCTLCAAEITFKTDPANADYVCELGATRNAEPWRQEARETEAAKIKRKVEEELDPMKALENRTLDSKKELGIAEALEEIRAVKAEMEQVDRDALLRQVEVEAQVARLKESDRVSVGDEKLTAEDEEVISQSLTRKKTLSSLKDQQGDSVEVSLPQKKPSRIAQARAALGIAKK